MTIATQRLCATLSSLLLVLSCWFPTLTLPRLDATTPAPQSAVLASASPIVLM